MLPRSGRNPKLNDGGRKLLPSAIASANSEKTSLRLFRNGRRERCFETRYRVVRATDRIFGAASRSLSLLSCRPSLVGRSFSRVRRGFRLGRIGFGTFAG